MPPTASLKLDDKDYPLPVLVGTEGEKAIDTRKLRADTGFICYDQGYGNTGSCESAITFLDGDNGILRYRGYPIEQLANLQRLRGDVLPGHLRGASEQAENGRPLVCCSGRTRP